MPAPVCCNKLEMSTLVATPVCAAVCAAVPVSEQQLSAEDIANAVLAEPVCGAQVETSPVKGWWAQRSSFGIENYSVRFDLV